MAGSRSRPIVIAPYDTSWPAAFEAERARLIAACPLIRIVEHVGSTAVAGLGAKPVIDIMPGVGSLTDADACIRPIESLGYEYVAEFEDEMPERRFFRRDTDGRRSHQIHLVVAGGEFWKRHLLFRDYLRAHAGTAAAYEGLKRELANRFDDVNEYADAKSGFVRAVEEAAARETTMR